ncbi:MAG: 23S rRNA (adenine(2503)-C(2))-methyltransferase RlmN [Peptococcaceae bacterium]|jgi:23S rRNA (adenine2503-C2)-methyltransferase|nr:23S rRNA (adenine(2503)-C(2))-methyltransferase RlmN [Peptococcaceae bacterium]
MERSDIRGLTELEIVEACRNLGRPGFRGKQIYAWVQQKAVGGWAEMRNLSNEDQRLFHEAFIWQPLRLIKAQTSLDGTRKYLFQLADGERIECVLMAYDRLTARDRRTVCLSTQVGCPIGCVFCATGQEGFKRNLSVGEIVAQVLEITRLMRLEDRDFKATNVVFMGMGEPLLNYDAVLAAIRILNSRDGQDIGRRRMTVSTSGIAPRIVDLARDDDQVGLAVSLHVADNATRDRLVPVNRRYPLETLLEACREYTRRTNRRITFEVALIAGESSARAARQMAELLRGQLAHVNLIPVNPAPGLDLRRPDQREISAFAGVLSAAGIPVSLREEKGTDIDAACGQLRRRWEEA